ncbi:MAG: glutamate--tRNA ligase [Rhizobiales bacterium]|nr:glutamate--tRNA ligase [Hyphomicrobiales bacterium]
MTIKVRFAPSPTGRIHIGNARTAILNWLFARRRGGQFVLRFDDTDLERSKQEYADATAQDLAWLGIEPDETHYQSKRFALYDAAAEKLKTDGRLYPCYETPDELERKRKRQMARGRPPVYDRAALELSTDDRAKLEADGRTAHWRFKLNARTVGFDDLIRGTQTFDLAHVSDPVLVRADGTYLYTLPSVVDDMDMGITHIIRGEDHVTNAAVQVDLFEALGGSSPGFAHHSLLTGADGKGLSKRLGSLSIGGLRDDGYEAMTVVSHAALLGTSDAIAPHTKMDQLIETFDLGKLSRAPARFDETELAHLNARLLHELPYEAVAGRVQGDAAFWEAIRGNISMLSEAADWHDIVYGDISPVIAEADREFAEAAAAALPAGDLDETTWKTWTGGLKETTGRKGKGLFMPLRLALTGLDHGPELANLLPLIGRDKAEARLRGETA